MAITQVAHCGGVLGELDKVLGYLFAYGPLRMSQVCVRTQLEQLHKGFLSFPVHLQYHQRNTNSYTIHGGVFACRFVFSPSRIAGSLDRDGTRQGNQISSGFGII
ncbi:hypothetical protein RJ639_032682 [Escallonia herrerae]|uniref:Uncharacterized protein n=1 Tax=Escallonia herrerae TaxID=1293975 RepID=A0AA88WXE7_9ASTE|nr:hypothetical protein RJ639_032682 [Escallonia herrerae]